MREMRWMTGVLSAALVLTVQPLWGQAQASSPAVPAATHEHGPMPKPKNLQVLPKDISHEQLIQLMRGFAGALGTKCSFCHAAGADPKHLDFASDAKPEKKIARTMMRMTHEIDTKYMAQVTVPNTTPEQQHVSCGTCHRGNEIPVVFVPPEHEHGAAPSSKPE